MERVDGPDFAQGYARAPGGTADEYWTRSPGSVTEKLANFPKFVDRSSLSRFLEDSGLTKPPYYPADPRMLESLRASFRAFWADELRDESFVR